MGWHTIRINQSIKHKILFTSQKAICRVAIFCIENHKCRKDVTASVVTDTSSLVSDKANLIEYDSLCKLMMSLFPKTLPLTRVQVSLETLKLFCQITKILRALASYNFCKLISQTFQIEAISISIISLNHEALCQTMIN